MTTVSLPTLSTRSLSLLHQPIRSFSFTSSNCVASSSSKTPQPKPPKTLYPPRKSSHPRIARLPQKSILEISGPDAPKFLKGLTCKDVDSLGGGYSGFINASGRVLHTNFIFPLGGGSSKSSNNPGTISNKPSQPTYLITHESPSDHPSPLETFLPPFKLRSKVRIKDVSSQWTAWASWGESSGQSSSSSSSAGEEGKKGTDHVDALPKRTWKLGSGGAAESQWSWPSAGVRDLELREGEVGCWDLRAGFENGWARQLLIPKDERPSLVTTHIEVPTSEYHLHRMLLGIPEGPNEIIPGSALPLESCMDVHGGVDFRKGCYLGQELTVRTYHTGATRKRLLPIRLIPIDSSSKSQLLSNFIPSPNETYHYLSPENDQNGTSVTTSTSTSTSTLPIVETMLIGSEITYYPGSESASQKPKSAGRVLSLLPSPSVGIVGIGIVRTEMASKTWWLSGLNQKHGQDSVGAKDDITVQDWWNGNLPRLGVKIGDVEFGVWVGEGEAYGAARRELQKVEKEKAERREGEVEA